MLDHRENLEPINDRLISFADVLKLIGISRSSAYRLIHKGALPKPVKIGALTFFSERELQAWIAAKLAARDEGERHD
jgi:predicted DNA-binding transcriptional regulator AlpA